MFARAQRRKLATAGLLNLRPIAMNARFQGLSGRPAHARGLKGEL